MQKNKVINGDVAYDLGQLKKVLKIYKKHVYGKHRIPVDNVNGDSGLFGFYA